MDNPKLRKLLILLHLYGAAFMAPAFLLLATSGGLYLMGKKGAVETTELTLPSDAALDFKSPTLEADVRTLLSSAGIDYKFEYVKNRGDVIQLRPTSRTYIEMKQTPAGLTASRKDPNLTAAVMEIHKGHGPTLIKTYHKLVALLLFGVVIGGIFVGLLAKAYRRKTLFTMIGGTVLYALIALFA